MLRILVHRAGLLTLMVICASLLGSPATGHEPDPTSHPPDACRCLEVEQGTGWCSACSVGFVGSVRVPSAGLFEMIDPHGHDLDPAGISCPDCMDALEAGTFCEPCGIGYVDGRAYVSRLAYLMARGEPVDSPALKAEFARLQAAMERLADCELCGVASYVDGRCPECRIHYQDGMPVNSRQTKKDESP
jgi:hypothetical protein